MHSLEALGIILSIMVNWPYLPPYEGGVVVEDRIVCILILPFKSSWNLPDKRPFGAELAGLGSILLRFRKLRKEGV
jgi:hypothetical protein